MNDYYVNLDKFYESKEIKPLLQGSIVQHGNTTYRTDRWFKEENHCYVFVCIEIEEAFKKPFGKLPSDVARLIEEGKLIIVKHFNLE